MTLALLDCPTGLAGNMLLAALLDLGLPEAAIHAPLAALGLAGTYRLQVEERRSGGLRGLHLAVESLEAQPPHRPWGDLRQRLADAALEPLLRQKVLEVFTLLAEAEATVHGTSPAQVHFHEVGALDSLVDVVGVCAGLLHFGIDDLVCGLPPAGHGTVATAHGSLPLPVPAVLEMARARAIPLASSEGFPPGELTTPTGLALIACWASRYGPAPAAVPLQVGVGLGTRRLDRANLLRLTLARGIAAVAGDDGFEDCEPLLLQQAQIDDATAEDRAFLAEALRQGGALEVFEQSIVMKKGRQGALVSALMPPALGPALRRIWWRHGTTLGVREQLQWRWSLPREVLRVETPLGPVRLKQACLPDGRRRGKPEYEDLATLARRHDLSLEQVRATVDAAMEQEP
jgi:uncharacterized protein (TIGR00299 family) protein